MSEGARLASGLGGMTGRVERRYRILTAEACSALAPGCPYLAHARNLSLCRLPRVVESEKVMVLDMHTNLVFRQEVGC